jgi:thiol-disulfide isomerase/thioredoxin
MGRWLSGLILAVFVSAGAGAISGEAPSDAVIPELRIATLDGTRFDLAAQRGRWVVVNYWATWCSPCLKEMPDLDAFAKSRADVAVIGLAYEEIEPEALRDFLVAHPVDYPIAIVDVFEPPTDFPAPRGLPMTWLIGPAGDVVKRFLGPVTAQDLTDAIAAAASGR